MAASPVGLRGYDDLSLVSRRSSWDVSSNPKLPGSSFAKGFYPCAHWGLARMPG